MIEGTVAVGYLDPGTWSATFGRCLLDLCLCDLAGPQRLRMQLQNRCRSGGIVDGRNEVARQFLDSTECEWLWFIDSDMGFAADTVESLLASADPIDRPVMGALAFKLHRDGPSSFYGDRFTVLPTVFDWYEDEQKVGFRSIPDYPRDSVVEVGATGAACILIHRSALETIRAKYGDCWFDRITHPTGPTTFSEDLSFCVRVAACDLPVFVNTAVKTTHDKGGVFLDEELFDRQQPQEAA